ncbi:flagellar hook-basal body protein [Novosphingobium sp. 9U]|uniref:flagellar hook-basal body protein n=1 Tax=Novosphingobium sp. 9U TaxID=2653158 RepID=UPI0012F224DF|nr:flagellar hook basal-body protein [Novosphingobium sp. 9U]VWX53037.1 Flagellar basal body protein [Novosphingobium sp. 9U]
MSYYTSISGLKNAQTDLNVISHNIANAETNGFKKSRVEFADIVASSSFTNPKQQQGIGSAVDSITQNFAIGPVEQTGSALDVAITGDGFFEIKAPGGQTMFTRNGSFAVDENGFIHDGSGNRLQAFAGTTTTGDPADIQIPPTAGTATFTGVTISPKGAVTASYSDGTNTQVGTIALATFIAPSGLKQVGSSNWTQTGLSGAPTFGAPDTGANGALLSGSIEHSNVDVAEELVNLITAQRYFQANAKAIDTATQISQTIIGLRS